MNWKTFSACLRTAIRIKTPQSPFKDEVPLLAVALHPQGQSPKPSYRTTAQFIAPRRSAIHKQQRSISTATK